MRLVLLGAPGAGKGTQAKVISENFNIPHISTGDILRNEIKLDTVLGRKASQFVKEGKLVPDELIIKIIKNEISKTVSKDGFLMDGFPRNLKQAKLFQKMLEKLDLKLDKVINIDVEKEELVKRLENRRMCHSCNNICSIDEFKDSNSERCPKCGGELFKRRDDDSEVISERLNVYRKETRPLIEYYRDENLLININGFGSQKEVTERILENL